MKDFEVHGGITLSEPATYPDKMNGMEIKREYVGKRNELLEKAEFITDNTEIGDDWRVSYKSVGQDESPLGYFQAFQLIDAAVRMLVLCYEEGYVETNKKE